MRHSYFGFFLTLLLLLPPEAAWSQATGVFASSVTLNSKGAGNVNYRMATATGFNHTQTALPASLGTFSGAETLNFSGGQLWTFKNGTGDVTSARMEYRVYPTGSPSGAFINVSLGFGADLGGGDQRWEAFGNTANLIAPGGTPLADGAYTLEIQGRAFTNLGDRTSGPFTTTFTVSSVRQTVQAGNWSAATTWDAGGVPASGALVQLNHNVTLDQAASVSSLTVASGVFTTSDGGNRLLTVANNGSVTVNSGATVSLAGGTLAFGQNGTLTNNGTVNGNTGIISFGSGGGGQFLNNGTFTRNTSTVSFFGTGTVGGSQNTTFHNVTLGAGVDFGAAVTSTIAGELRLNSGGFVNTNAPAYAAGSTLAYATGGGYGRNLEWSSATQGAKGCPANVLVTNSTGVRLPVNGGIYLGLGNVFGNLTVESGSSLFMDFSGSMNVPLTVSGNVTTVGTGAIILSNNSNGNLRLNGNLTLASSGALVTNNRAVFFDNTGAGQSVSAAAALAYVVSNTPTLTLLTDLSITAPGQGNGLTLNGNLDLNGRTLSFATGLSGGAKVELLVNTSIRTISSGSGTGTLVLPGDNRISSGAGGTLVLATSVLLQTGGSGIRPITIGGITTINGTLEILPGGYVDGTDGPTWGTGSTLRYNTGGSYNRLSEWDGTTAARRPFNVEVTGNTTLNAFKSGATGTVQLRGNMSIMVGSTLDLSDQPSDVIVDGNLTNVGTITFDNATGALTVGGNFINSGTTTLSTQALAGDVSVAGNLTNSGTFTFGNTASALLVGGNFLNTGRMTLSTQAGADDVRITGNLTNSGTLTLGSGASADLQLGGNFDNTGTFNSNGRALFFINGLTQTVSSNTPLAINYVVVRKSGGQVQLLSNLTVAAPTGGTPLDFNQSAGPNVFNLNGRTLTLGTAAAASTAGTIPANSGYTDNGAGTLVIVGDGDFGTLRFTSGTTLGTLTLARTGTTGGAALGSALRLATALSLNQTNTKLALGANTLTLAPAATISATSANRYVVSDGTGVLAREGMGTGGVTTAQLFPVGTATAYNPATLANTGTLDTYSVRVSSTSAQAVPNPSLQLTRYWTVEEGTAGGSSATMTLQWNGPTEEGASFDRTDPLLFTRLEGGLYSVIPATSAQVSTAPYTATLAGITALSEWSLGNQYVLPVELLYFTGRMNGPDAVLAWQTATEKDNQLFDVERSVDGRRFERVGTLPGAGTTTQARSYRFTDHNVARLGASVLYYRLRQLDFDGTTSFSNVVTIAPSQTSGTEPIILPTILETNEFTVQLFANTAGTAELTLTDAAGRIVHQSKPTVKEGYNYISSSALAGYNGLAPGMYVARVTQPGWRPVALKIVRR